MKPLTLQSAHDKQSETIQKQAHKIAMLVKQVEANGECHKGLTAKPCHCEAIESAHDKLKQLCDDLFENPYYVEYELANATCLFCGRIKGKPHADYCKVVKYKALVELEQEEL
jgi:phosphoribosylformylglycinamidine (FGAM) synthase PurS component